MLKKQIWKVQLAQAGVTQKEVGEFLGIDSSSMSLLAKKMNDGQGLIASTTDKKRWSAAQEYLGFKKEQLNHMED